MNKQEIEVLRAAGDWYALNGQTVIVVDLNPYYFEDDDDEPRVPDWKKVNAVEHLLSIVEASSGAAAAKTMREALRFRYEMHEASNTPYLWELNEDLWLRYADLVCIRALEQLHPGSQLMTTAEVERAYGLAAGTANKAAQRGSIPAEKRGHDWWILRSDAEKQWGDQNGARTDWPG